MGIVLGYILLVCFCILFAKVLTRKLHLKRADKILMKMHKKVCVIAVICCVLHMIFVFPVLWGRSVYVLVTGIVAVVIIAGIILFCYVIKEKTVRLRWHRILSAGLLVVIILHIVICSIGFVKYQDQMSAIQISGIDTHELADGTYVGSYDVGYIYAKVEVTVKSGKIVDIELIEHKNEKGEPAEKIVDKIIKEQNTDVDAVSGATNSSKVIKKAVEEALQN